MIKEEQKIIIEEMINGDNSLEVLFYHLEAFCNKNPNKTIDLQQAVINLTKIYARHQEQKLNDAKYSLYLAICAQDKINDNISFITAIEVCMTLFPNGSCNYSFSPNAKRYYNAFLKYLKNNREEYVDSDWAIMFGYNDYLKMVLEQTA